MRSILAIPFALAAVVVAGIGFLFFGVAALLSLIARTVSGE